MYYTTNALALGKQSTLDPIAEPFYIFPNLPLPIFCSGEGKDYSYYYAGLLFFLCNNHNITAILFIADA